MMGGKKTLDAGRDLFTTLRSCCIFLTRGGEEEMNGHIISFIRQKSGLLEGMTMPEGIGAFG